MTISEPKVAFLDFFRVASNPHRSFQANVFRLTRPTYGVFYDEKVVESAPQAHILSFRSGGGTIKLYDEASHPGIQYGLKTRYTE